MSQDNVEIVRTAFLDSLNRDPRLDESWRDASDFYDENFEYREDPSWPGAGTYRGIEAFRKVTSDYAEAFEEMTLELERTFDAGDCVVAFIRFWARGKGGAEAEMHQAGIFTVRDGRLASWQVVFDRAEALEAAGLSQ
jgi:ketosteroid isomerase-like protein